MTGVSSHTYTLRGGGKVSLDAVHRLLALWRALLLQGAPDALTVPMVTLARHVRDHGGRVFAGCNVAAAVTHARRRHGVAPTTTAPRGSEQGTEEGLALDFKDFLRVLLPRATAADIAGLLDEATSRLTRDDLMPAVEDGLVLAEHELDQMLSHADADSSGELDRAEFCALLERLGVCDPEERNSLFDEADSDCSGFLSAAEFRAWWLSHVRDTHRPD